MTDEEFSKVIERLTGRPDCPASVRRDLLVWAAEVKGGDPPHLPPFRDLPFSMRLHRLLEQYEIFTWNALLSLHGERLAALYGFGPMHMRELISKTAEAGADVPESWKFDWWRKKP